MLTENQLRNIFEASYSQNDWYNVLRTNFNATNLKDKKADITARIKSNEYNAKAYELGSLETIEGYLIGLYEVDVPVKAQLHRNRKSLRDLLTNIYGDVDAALIVFVQGDKWRFTYVSEISTRDANGKRQKKATDPKRYTYLFGEGEKAKTAAQQFSKLRVNRNLLQEGIKLSALNEAFNVEKMSKAFFDEYREHYGKFTASITGENEKQEKIKNASPFLKSTFNGDKKAARDFVKKMLGRIVFLYFLEKKGWLGVPVDSKWGDGDENFLSNLYRNSKDHDAFYSNVLVPLFFTALNNKRPDDIFKLPNGEKVKIPFLNGGLFEEDDTNTQFLHFPKQLFTDLFDFFDRYNFTVYEDSPDEHTVAVDPEMLGHIFENLLEDNKDKGAYYTPKEIVHYMCQESLIEYLYTKINPGIKAELDTTGKAKTEVLSREAIAKFIKHAEAGEVLDYEEAVLIALYNVKVCDPAIGSGAFPMGVLMEIFHAVETMFEASPHVTKKVWKLKSNDWVDNRASVKLNIVQNSIYGVDIEQGAVDIARLRFWLSLVVDEDIPQPLPNLDYKIVVGNSLLSTYNDVLINIDWAPQNKNASKVEKIITEQQVKLPMLQEKQRLYFVAQHVDKKKLKRIIRDLKIDILLNQVQLTKIKFDESNPVSNSLYPTGREILRNEAIKEQSAMYAHAIERLRSLKKTEEELHFFDWKLNFPEVMNDKVIKNIGFDIVIGNPPYVSAVTMARDESVKAYFKQEYPEATGAYDLYVLFLLKGRKLLKQGGSTFSWIIPNKFLISDYAKKTKEILLKEGLKVSVDVSIFEVFRGIGVYPIILLSNGGFVGKFSELLLSNYEDLEAGRFKMPQMLREHNTIKDLGIKVASGATGFEAQKIKNIVTERPSKSTIPFIVSGSVDRYYWSNSNVRYMKLLLREAYVKKDLSVVAASKWKFWTNPKIVVAGMTKEIESVYTPDPVGLGVGIYGIYEFGGFDPYFIVAVLNSKYLTFYFRNKFKDKHLAGGYLAINKSTIEALPFVKPEKEVEKKLASLAKQIADRKESSPDLESSKLEDQIDQIVYELFDVSSEEIEIINSSLETSIES